MICIKRRMGWSYYNAQYIQDTPTLHILQMIIKLIG